jgi:hypothetical protein
MTLAGIYGYIQISTHKKKTMTTNLVLVLVHAHTHTVSDTVREIDNHFIGDLGVSLFDFMQHVALRELQTRHHWQGDLGVEAQRMVQSVGGSDILSRVLSISQQQAIVGVHTESGPVRRSNRESETVSGCHNVGSVPDIHVDLVHLALGHVHRGDATLSPSHANSVILDDAHFTSGVDIRDLHHEVSVDGVGRNVQLGKHRTSQWQFSIKHRSGELQHISSVLNCGLIKRSTLDGSSDIRGEVVATVGDDRVGRIRSVRSGTGDRGRGKQSSGTICVQVVIHHLGLGELLHGGPVLARLQTGLIIGGHHVEGDILDHGLLHRANSVQLEQLSNLEASAAHDGVLLEVLSASQAVAQGINENLGGVSHRLVHQIVVAIEGGQGAHDEQIIPSTPESGRAVNVLVHGRGGLDLSPEVVVHLVFVHSLDVIVHNIRVGHGHTKQPVLSSLLLVVAIGEQDVVH